ncbi:MAG TPA: hypothetical protein VD978_32175 [Azospirillum sp.]|nr:hypothetical protein [Azospirillum sp.]
MSNDFYHTHRYRSRTGSRHDASDTMARVRAYLRSRPTESWLFFFAGIVAGALLG